MKQWAIPLALSISMLFLNSCATLLSGMSDKITFNSDPPGATVYLDGVEVGKTNNDIEVKRKFKGIRKATYKKDGYIDLSFDVVQKITPAYWINIVGIVAFGFGIIPSLIDIVDGAAMQPRDKRFEKTLEKR